jgi:hypothetical protein
MPEVNRPAIVAQVQEVFERYEEALVANDTDTLNQLFWSSPRTVRFGVADAQDGYDEVVHWRSSQGPLPRGRTLSDTNVLTFGDDVGVVTTQFRYPERSLIGRQTQTWLRTPDGWKITTAHVSEIAEPSESPGPT